MPHHRTVSLVLPVHNEAEVLPRQLATLQEFMGREHRVSFEVVIVDDGSRDASAALARLAADADPRIRLVRLSRNFGKEAAVTAGIRSATGDAVVPMDADGQDPIEVVGEFITAWLGGAAVVLGHRSDRSSDHLLKRWTAAAFYRVFNRLTAVRMPPEVGDFRLMDRAVVDAFLQLPERERFLKGLFAYVGFEPTVVEYARPKRHSGRSNFSAWRLWNFALDGLFSFSTAPLRIWSYLGVLGVVGGLTYAAFVFILAARGGVPVPGYASTLLVVLVMGALNLTGIGILGEYLGRVYSETKQRPLYIIAESYPPAVQHG